jgi:hypothetical protein
VPDIVWARSRRRCHLPSRLSGTLEPLYAVIYLLVSKKNCREKRHTNGPNDVSDVVWAHSRRRRRLPSRLSGTFML